MSEVNLQAEPDHPIVIMGREVEAAKKETDRWRSYAAACLVLSAVLAVLLVVVAGMYGKSRDELTGYHSGCLRPPTAEALLQASEQLSQVNVLCLKSHQRHMHKLQEVLPKLFSEENTDLFSDYQTPTPHQGGIGGSGVDK